MAMVHGEAASASKVAAAATEAKRTPGPVIPPDINGFKTIIEPMARPHPVKVAIYQGPGAPESSATNVSKVVALVPGASARIVTAEEVGTLDLTMFDVVVFPGGSGSGQAKAIGETGRAKVREYVKNGGGYVGICAGAYLACTNFDWGLGLLNASTVSSKWMRGSGFVDLEVAHDGRPILGEVEGRFKVRYNNGPIIKPAARADLPSYQTLAFFRTEVAKNGSPAGVMVDSPAQAVSTYGKGRVFISSPHPENTPGLEHLIPRGILWAAGKGPVEPQRAPVP
jgi:type 1 glutamine amidotransferase